jgi:hypothetical protein
MARPAGNVWETLPTKEGQGRCEPIARLHWPLAWNQWPSFFPDRRIVPTFNAYPSRPGLEDKQIPPRFAPLARNRRHTPS